MRKHRSLMHVKHNIIMFEQCITLTMLAYGCFITPTIQFIYVFSQAPNAKVRLQAMQFRAQRPRNQSQWLAVVNRKFQHDQV